MRKHLLNTETLKYSKILLIQLPQDWKGAELMNILDYQTVPTLT
jgi:hypothetical protein